MTTSHKSEAFPMVCHRVLCLAQFSSSSFTKPLSDLIQCHSIESQSFADDTQLQVSCPSIEHSICNIFSRNHSVRHPDLDAGKKLNLKNIKTEALLLRSSSRFFSVGKPTTISLCGCEISFSSFARNLGFYIRDDMGVELHIKNVRRSAYSELRRISTIRHLLSVDSTKHLCPPLSSLGLIIVTRSSQAALNILKNYKRSKTPLQDSSYKLINEIMFHPFSELFTGYPSKHVSNISCQPSVTPFSLIHLLFICLTFSVSVLSQDSSAPHLIQEPYTFRT